MNFLSHAHLSGLEDEEELLGNMLGDFVKGSLTDEFPPRVLEGMRLHREIDAHADRHPLWNQARNTVSPARRRCAGILVDIFFDHFLAANWDTYSDTPLEDFAPAVYGCLDRVAIPIPETAARVFQSMAEHEWFTGYAAPTGVARALRRMSERSPAMAALHGGEEELLAHYDVFGSFFRRFYPQLSAHVRLWRERRRAMHPRRQDAT